MPRFSGPYSATFPFERWTVCAPIVSHESLHVPIRKRFFYCVLFFAITLVTFPALSQQAHPPPQQVQDSPTVNSVLAQSASEIETQAVRTQILDNETTVKLYEAGDLRASLSLAIETVKQAKQQKFSNNPMTAILLDNLGGLYAANQQYSLAEATYLQAISVNVLIYKSNSAEVASAFRRLGELYELSGRVTDAEQAYRKSITIFKQSSEPRKHAHVVGLLASMLIDGGRSTEAYSLYADALAFDGSLIYKKYSAPVVAAAGFEIPPPNTDQNSAPTINTSKLSRVEPKEPGLYDAVEIYYGTDRKIVQKTENGDSYDLYGSERNGSLQLGRAIVTIPKAHRFGSVERPWRIKIPFSELTITDEDPVLHFSIQKNESLTENNFIGRSKLPLDQAHVFNDRCLVYVHGYDTTFRNAAYRLAQIVYDLDFDGLATVYSWPSGGAYEYDEQSARQASEYFSAFVALLFRDVKCRSVGIIAHSMGNLVLLEALGEIVKIQGNKPGNVESQVILAAPDVDTDVYKSLLKGVLPSNWALTLYASADDLPLKLSREIAGGVPRAGDVPTSGPVLLPGVDSIDVTDGGIEWLSLNHSYYADRSWLLNDIKLILLKGLRPPLERSPILLTVNTPLGTYWKFPGNSGGKQSEAPVNPNVNSLLDDMNADVAKRQEFYIHVGSERSIADATTAFARIKEKYSDILSQLTLSLDAQRSPGDHVWYRALVSPPMDSSTAIATCKKLQVAGLRWCDVVHGSGNIETESKIRPDKKASKPNPVRRTITSPSDIPLAEMSPPETSSHCTILTARYGGARTLLILSVGEDKLIFTALTVDIAKAKKQAQAFISVHARGGNVIGVYNTQNEALSRAYTLCPEG